MRKRFFLILTVFSFVILFMIFLRFLRFQPVSLTVGAKNNTEQHIIGEIIATLVEEETDIKVARKFNLEGTTVSFKSLFAGDIDLYCEYTGTALTSILHESIQSSSTNALAYLREKFTNKYRLRWLESLGFQNSYVLLMRKNKAEDLKVETISDLSKISIELSNCKIAFDPEFYAREEYKLLKDKYFFTPHAGVKIMDQSILYLTLLKKDIDVISASSTDGLILLNDLKILKDNQKIFPPYEAAILIREDTLLRLPQIEQILNRLSGKITTDRIRRMNYEVEKKEKNVYQVVRKFLLDEDLIKKSKDK